MLINQTPTDQIKKVELPSSIQQVLWTRPNAAVDAKVGIEVFRSISVQQLTSSRETILSN